VSANQLVVANQQAVVANLQVESAKV